MTDIRRKAEQSTESTRRPNEQAGHRMTPLSDQLLEADEVSEEGQFPEFGDWLEVENLDTGDTEYWECPQGLAEVIVLAAEETESEIEDIEVAVEHVVKSADGRWRYVSSEAVRET